MNEDLFNAEMRKFLKEFGVTSQREIEKSVYGWRDAGTLGQHGRFTVRAILEIDGEKRNVVDREISLG